MNPEHGELNSKEQRELELLAALQAAGAEIQADPLRVQGAYVVVFPFEGGQTTVRISLRDSNGADMTITHMTTLPESEMGKGHGSGSIAKITSAAKNLGFHDIRAVQVKDHVKDFWEHRGFKKAEGENRTGEYVLEN